MEDLYELPPMSLVLKTLRAAKCKVIEPKVFFSLIPRSLLPANPKRYFPGLSDLNVTSLTDMCQKVYFPTEDCSPAFVTVVICGLWKMFNNFGEHDLHQHGLDELEFERARALCKRSLDDAARCTPLLVEHSYRQIQALLLLVSRACVRLVKRGLKGNSLYSCLKPRGRPWLCHSSRLRLVHARKWAIIV